MVDLVTAIFAFVFFKLAKHHQQKQAYQTIMPTFQLASQT